MGWSGNPVFLGFVTGQSSRTGDEGLRKRAERAQELLEMAGNRRKLGVQR